MFSKVLINYKRSDKKCTGDLVYIFVEWKLSSGFHSTNVYAMSPVYIYIIYTHTHIYIYIYIYTHTHIYK